MKKSLEDTKYKVKYLVLEVQIDISMQIPVYQNSNLLIIVLIN